MKQQDIAVLILVVFITGMASFFIAGKIVPQSDKQETAEVVSPIYSDFPLPSSDNFNVNAENPTVRIEIAPTDNDQPFAN